MKKYLPLLLVICGCAAHPIHPGTANAFDSSTYDTLTITDSVIQSTKADLSAGKFPASIAQNVKTALNILITSYDVLDMAYCGTPVAGVGSGSLQCAAGSYHAAAMAGTATPTQNSVITADVNAVNSASATLTTAKATN
jgi:hypothetical protein